MTAFSYTAYGKAYSINNVSGIGTTLASTTPLTYRGYVLDTGTGHYYLQSRYYDPSMGRFINADAFASTGQGVSGYNMFAYCNNNPILFHDPTGQWLAWSMFWDSVLGDGVFKKFNHRSEIARDIRKSTSFQSETATIIDNYTSSLSYSLNQSRTYLGVLDTYKGTTKADKDLALSVGSAKYVMHVEKETKTSGMLWWKKEKARYKINVTVYDRYDFTEWREGTSFGTVMNNAAYIGQVCDVIIPYEWEVKFVYYTDWR